METCEGWKLSMYDKQERLGEFLKQKKPIKNHIEKNTMKTKWLGIIYPCILWTLIVYI